MKTPHDIVWAVIEEIARMNNLTVSALAKKANLDATSFNISKRVGLNGPHYPSFTTLLAVFKATGLDWKDWARLWEKAQKD